MIEAIRDPSIRSHAVLQVAWARLAIVADVGGVIRQAAVAEPSPARDSLYVAASVKLAHTRPDDARALTARVADPAWQAIARVMIGSVQMRAGDTTAARLAFREALPAVDALGHGFAWNVLQGPVRAGEDEALRLWARGQATAGGRALAFVAILEAATKP